MEYLNNRFGEADESIFEMEDKFLETIQQKASRNYKNCSRHIGHYKATKHMHLRISGSYRKRINGKAY